MIQSFKNILFIPAFLGIITPTIVFAGGSDHANHVHSGRSSPSTMIMAKTNFVVRGLDGVTSMGTSKD